MNINTKNFLINNNTKYRTTILIIVVLYLIYYIPAIYANSISNTRLFMDEQISFDETVRLFNSNNLLTFIKNYISGDQRYGRIIYLITYVVTYIPNLFFHEQGQIITTRFLLFLLLIFSYILLIETFLVNNYFKILSFIVFLSIPSTVYYSTLPKPEPFLLFFFSLFCYYWFKNRTNPIIFIFLGIAFGCKISIFLLIPVIFIYHFINWNSYNFIFKSILFFTIGFMITVPIVPLSLIKHDLFNTYLNNTFLNTTHDSDNSNINFLVWINKIFNDWIKGPIILKIVLVIVTFSIIVKNFKLILSKRKYLLLIFSILLLLPIIFLTKRVWFFYLHIGFIFLALSIIVLYEDLYKLKKNTLA